MCWCAVKKLLTHSLCVCVSGLLIADQSLSSRVSITPLSPRWRDRVVNMCSKLLATRPLIMQFVVITTTSRRRACREYSDECVTAQVTPTDTLQDALLQGQADLMRGAQRASVVNVNSNKIYLHSASISLRPQSEAPFTMFTSYNVITNQCVAIQVAQGAYAPPVRKIHNFFGMWFLSVIGLHVKPSGCANIFVN